MTGLRSKAGLLTKEERLVFLTVSVCLLGGGLFHLALSVLDLPDALDPLADTESWPDGEPTARPGRESTVAAPVGGAWGSPESEGGAFPAGETPAGGAGARERNSTGAHQPGRDGMLELNGATQAELEELPGIGPALARRILEHRARVGEFKTVEDLLDVSGIGDKTLSRFRAYVYVSQSTR